MVRTRYGGGAGADDARLYRMKVSLHNLKHKRLGCLPTLRVLIGRITR